MLLTVVTIGEREKRYLFVLGPVYLLHDQLDRPFLDSGLRIKHSIIDEATFGALEYLDYKFVIAMRRRWIEASDSPDYGLGRECKIIDLGLLHLDRGATK